MEQEAAYFGENSIIKTALHKKKRPININYVDIEEVALSLRKSYSKDSFKYFTGYRHKGNAFPSPLCVKLRQMNAYVNYFDKNNKSINLLVNDKEILKKYSELWNKIKGLIKKEFNNEPVYNDKIKLYNNKVYTNFQHNKIPKDNEYFACFFCNIVRFYFC